MKYGKLIGLACASGVLGLVAVSVAQPSVEQPEMPLPPGWTMDDMMACVQAGTPGEHHAELVKEAGVWKGSGTMWMGPGGEAVPTTVVMTVTPILDGRYIRIEMNGEFPGMGPYTGMGITGYDNVAGRYVSDWVDNQSSGIMRGSWPEERRRHDDLVVRVHVPDHQEARGFAPGREDQWREADDGDVRG
jgi:hypothetical protein